MLSGPARKAWGWEGFKETYLLVVTLKPSHPQAITNRSNSWCRGTRFLRFQLRLLDFDGGADLHPLRLQVSRISLQVRAPRRKPGVVRMAGKFRLEQRALGGDRRNARLDLLELLPQPGQRIAAGRLLVRGRLGG